MIKVYTKTAGQVRMQSFLNSNGDNHNDDEKETDNRWLSNVQATAGGVCIHLSIGKKEKLNC